MRSATADAHLRRVLVFASLATFFLAIERVCPADYTFYPHLIGYTFYGLLVFEVAEWHARADERGDRDGGEGPR